MDPAVLAGLAAYDRDEFDAAAASWEAARPKRSLRPSEARLLSALAALAKASSASRKGQRVEADRYLGEARSRLAGLHHRTLGVDVTRLLGDLAHGLGESANPPRPHAAHRSRYGLWIKLGLLLALLAGSFAAFRWTPLARLIEPERLSAMLAAARGHWWTPGVLLLLYAGLCPLGLPATPLLFAGGAIFGSALGSFWNIVGTLLGAATTFALARYLGREAVERLGGDKLARAERMVNRHGFWALVSVRFLPLPFPLVNAAAAVAGVRFPQFMASAAIGLTPAVAVWTYFSAAIVRAAATDRARIAREMVAALALLVALVMVPTMTRLHRRRMRLARFKAARQRRLAAESAAAQRAAGGGTD